MDDASLDQFVGTDDDEDDGEDDESLAVDTGRVEQAVSTYAWNSEPRACADCGEETTRLWQDEAGLVCPTCKNW